MRKRRGPKPGTYYGPRKPDNIHRRKAREGMRRLRARRRKERSLEGSLPSLCDQELKAINKVVK